jgi:hypothetical protein
MKLVSRLFKESVSGLALNLLFAVVMGSIILSWLKMMNE